MKLLSCVVLLLGLASTTTGCGPALHPFFTSSDLYEDPALEGRWISGGEHWEFTRIGDGRYTASDCDPDCRESTPVTLFRLGGQVFLDVQESKSSLGSSAIFPHGVMRLRIEADRVEVTPLDQDALVAGGERKRYELSAVRLDESRVLVTAPTAKLREFLSRHAGDPQLWGETQVFQRAADGPASPSQQAGQ